MQDKINFAHPILHFTLINIETSQKFNLVNIEITQNMASKLATLV